MVALWLSVRELPVLTLLEADKLKRKLWLGGYRGQIDAMGEKSVVLRNRGVQLENKCQEKAVWWELTERCSG